MGKASICEQVDLILLAFGLMLHITSTTHSSLTHALFLLGLTMNECNVNGIMQVNVLCTYITITSLQLAHFQIVFNRPAVFL